MNDGNEVYEQIRELIGADGADKLMEAFGGSSIYIPNRAAIADRHRLIRHEFHGGADYRTLAIRYGYTESYIRRIVNKKK
jgi:Mor family transcriptional regulator